MKYSEFRALVEEDVNSLVARLKGNSRNKLLDTLYDYYDGSQWLLNDISFDETRFTRSGKQMWGKLDKKNPSKGFNGGELKVWNILRSAIDIYSKYTRGDARDDVKVVVKNGKTTDKDKTIEANNLWTDLNIFVEDFVREMSITSVGVTKYTKLEDVGDFNPETDDQAILSAMMMSDDKEENQALVEAVDPRTIEPLYWFNRVRGMIHFFPINKAQAEELGFDDKRFKHSFLYWEVWFIDDKGNYQVDRYVNSVKLEDKSGDSPFEKIGGWIIQPNAKRPRVNFDLEHIEISDAQNIIELQDDMNAFLTDLGIIYRKVAIPMLKITDEFMKDATGGDITKVKEQLETMFVGPASILFAPVEKLGAEGPADTQVRYLQDLLDQYYRETGIPRSVFNSEGLANVSTETVDHLFQSLRTRIDDKRSRTAKVINENVKMHFREKGEWTKEMTSEVEWPDMFSSTKKALLEMLEVIARLGLVSKSYLREKTIQLVGDSERLEDIKAEAEQEGVAARNDIETNLAKQSLTNEESQKLAESITARNRDIRENQNG